MRFLQITKKIEKLVIRRRAVFLFASAVFFVSGALFVWAATLQMPDLSTFDERRVEQSTKIYDRTGEILLFDVHKNIKRTIVPIETISRHIKNATVAIEDSKFYEHSGVRPSAIIRAILINIGAFGYEQGGSTITQQVVKNSILTREKTISRKLKEWILSLKLERVASKEQILELYLNEAPYGGSIYGVEEASLAFFGKNSFDLTLAESAYLAALPRAPTYYSPYGGNRDKLDERKNLVLQKMLDLHFISQNEYEDAREESPYFLPPETGGIRAPHFVFYVLEQLENKFGNDILETSGLRVVTTLDHKMQIIAEEVVKTFAEENAEKFNANNMGLVAIDPKTGQVLAMVGSLDYWGESRPEGCLPGINCVFDPQVNITTVKPGRQPGSAFKPFVYATGFAKGYTPETIVFDLPTQFHSGCDSNGKPLFEAVTENECYLPQNYDEVFRGPVTLRDALAQSINVPAIKVLYLAGLQDSFETARNMGIGTLTNPGQYGLTLVLGGGEVSLVELTSAYSVFANNGIRNPHKEILRIDDDNGKIIEQFKENKSHVLSKNVALQISDILSDNGARAPAFGDQSYLYFKNRDVAAKTGTTNDYRDAWIVGYTPSIAVGMWAGNNNNEPMEKRVAGFIVAPAWNAFMMKVFENLPQEEFDIPEKDPMLSSLKPILRGNWLGGESYFVDSLSQKLATEYTPNETREERFVVDVHSELYWIDKTNPRGNPPDSPEKDPQFRLWETPVLKWAKEQNISSRTSAKPTEYDPIHKPEFAPKIIIQNLDSTKTYSKKELVRFTVSGSGRYGFLAASLYINNVYVGETKKSPFVFSPT